MSRKDAPRNLKRLRLATTAGCWLLPAARVQAHTTLPGLGEYANGFLHPFVTPPHLLILLALGLWLGQRAPLRIKEPAAVFAVAAAFGLACTILWRTGAISPVFLIAVGLCIGGCVSTAILVPFWFKLVVCGATALILGLDSGVDPGTAPAAAGKILCATWVSLVLCVVNAAFYVSLLPMARPAQIGVRVAGSWIVAIAFLLLAFSLRR